MRAAAELIRVLGRPGTGPGEFQTTSQVAIGPGDTIYITDVGNARLTVLTPSFEYVRSAPFPPLVQGLAVLPDGTLLVNANIADPETVGLPFHLLRPDGYRFGAIGHQDRALLPSEAGIRSGHAIAPSPRGGFWAAAHYGRYLIERWDLSGHRQEALQRAPTWHVPLPEPLRGDINKLDPPVTRIQGLWEARDGMIWVVAQVGDPGRKRALTDTIRTPEGYVYVTGDLDRIWDTVVEVLDPRRRLVMASQRFDAYFRLVPGPGRVVHVRQGADGQTLARVLTFHVVR